MLKAVNILVLVSRAKTCYDLMRARSADEMCSALACGITSEILLCMLKQEIQDEYDNYRYW